ncbi:MAG: 1-acyl-sn-glycerol-3-phosphate acyltransferase [Spirochaetales bacterium]|nr:1-acyl-sn-glycerol-3-phosphate acyltransferase [Spirochaetales bacterium]
MIQYFPKNNYLTQDQIRRLGLDRLFLGSRWGLYAHFAGEVFRSRALALKNEYDDEQWAASSSRILSYIEGCGGRFHISGFDNIRAEKEPVVFISNHMSTLETVILPVLIAPIKKATYVVKDKLVSGNIFGPIMRSRNPITVTRTNPREDLKRVLSDGANLLTQGYSIITFPESTRYQIFDPRRFNTLGIKLARAAGAKAVPIALKTDFWDNGRMLKGFGPLRREKPIHIEFGRALKIQGTGKKEHAKIVEFIQSRLADWQSSSDKPT